MFSCGQVYRQLAVMMTTGLCLFTSPAWSAIECVGSDTVEPLIHAWSRASGIAVTMEAKGSSTAPPALTQGRAQIAPMSRKIKRKELAAFEIKYGYKPTQIRVALDALAIFVHKDNPVAGLTLQQVDGIFSSTYKCAGAPIKRWADVGVTGSLADKTPQLHGRNQQSGTYAFFKKKALCKGDYHTSVSVSGHTDDIIHAVGSDIAGIGYGGLGSVTNAVRMVPLAKRPGSAFVEASGSNAATGQYPLSRFLYIYVNKPPGEALADNIAAFLRFALSAQGQQIVSENGFQPLPTKVIEKDSQKAGL